MGYGKLMFKIMFVNIKLYGVQFVLKGYVIFGSLFVISTLQTHSRFFFKKSLLVV